MTRSSQLLRSTPAGLYCPAGDFYIDPSRAVPRALVTHGHSDHARPGSGEYFCASSSVALIRHRLGKKYRVQGVPYGEIFELGEALVSFHPAGHILGSAQVRIEVGGEVWVVTGDYKRDEDPSCEPFEVVRCDTFVTEATFGLPIYRWPEMRKVAREMWEWWEEGRAHGLATVIYGYSLGKTQRVLAELARFTDRTVWLHPSADELTNLYRQEGVTLLPHRCLNELPSAGRSLAGELIVAPPGTLSASFLRRIGPVQTAFASGWMMARSGWRSRSQDRGFVVSDHADWPTLVRTARETGASQVLVMHGQNEILARYLREIGIEAQSVERGL